MNIVMMMGRLTRDPEIRINGESTTARFSIAVNRSFQQEGQPSADFFDCVAFGKKAEFVQNYLKKGTKVVLTGEIRNNNYEKDGITHRNISIIANHIEFAESKGSQDAAVEGAAVDSDGFMSIPDGVEDELPFN